MNTRDRGELPISGPIDVDALTAEGRAQLGPLIEARRKSRGMTQLELAVAAGVDRKTLGTIESGKRAGQADKLRALLEALEIPQLGDVDRGYDDATRSFIASTAPIFDRLPASIKAEAQHDVVVLLTGKLARSANVDASVDDVEHREPRTLHGLAADEGPMKMDQPAADED
ncbi:helix-turn-helix domain-containing protein [Microbacterium sp. kSW2-24]|uniref:helix-turn-helix domain-containing protein n=1 Tax=Microbacterium galbinum TaxID=2851646 RepID=UPI001FFC4711|nr:helix-turn-helix transcriptional regulator [Microbacterium galbinum]MCK2024613.1 helix-turn-helix domain-containing protein [Microbacterium galbinum]